MANKGEDTVIRDERANSLFDVLFEDCEEIEDITSSVKKSSEA